MCWSRNRYGANKGCDIHRFNADELEAAIGQALLDFYTNGHDIIKQAISTSLAAHQQANGSRHQELASIKHQLVRQRQIEIIG